MGADARGSRQERTVSLEKLLGYRPGSADAKRVPARFHVRGPMQLPLDGPRVSIVGTRHPSEKGVAAARDLASSLAEKGVTVVSGLATGIDAASHRAAMEKGRTVAVLGTPLERAYPAQNRQLQDEIMTKHLAVSQFAPRSAVARANFVMRDLTMALISDATVIVEAGERSGTAHQGREAVRLGRPLFMGRVADAPWTRDLRERGARRGCAPKDVLASLPQTRQARL